MIKDLQVVLSRNENVVSRRIDTEVIFVPIRRQIGDLQCIYTTNEVGGRTWDLIDGKRSLQEILAIIVDEYDVTPDEAKADVEEFVKQLVEAGCVLEK